MVCLYWECQPSKMLSKAGLPMRNSNTTDLWVKIKLNFIHIVTSGILQKKKKKKKKGKKEKRMPWNVKYAQASHWSLAVSLSCSPWSVVYPCTWETISGDAFQIFVGYVHLRQWPSSKGVCPQGTFGNAWGHFWLSRLERCYWHSMSKVGEGSAVKHPTIHRTVPTTNNSSAPNVNSTEVKKSWVRIWLKFFKAFLLCRRGLLGQEIVWHGTM